MIALPTLTVLIGAVGDSVTDFVNWGTLWLGKHAPDLAQLFGGFSSSSDKEKAVKAVIEKVESEDSTNDGFAGIADVERGKVVPAGMSNDFGSLSVKLADDAYRPFIMLQVAQKIVSHLDQSEPKRYTYEEWTFLLRLLGEDESDESGHRRIGQPLAEDTEIATPVRQNSKQVWSWMGQESPLMSLEDDSEPKWVLRKLMEVLEKELKHRGDQRVARQVGEQMAVLPPSDAQ